MEADQLLEQARRCRKLASGLSNREDIRTLEKLASELESRARAVERHMVQRPRINL